MDRTPVSLLFDCGYARVAVFEFSAVKRGKSEVSVFNTNV